MNEEETSPQTWRAELPDGEVCPIVAFREGGVWLASFDGITGLAASYPRAAVESVVRIFMMVGVELTPPGQLPRKELLRELEEEREIRTRMLSNLASECEVAENLSDILSRITWYKKTIQSLQKELNRKREAENP